MAIHNDSRLYSAGNVVFDPQPISTLYGNLMAKRQAKMDALDEYDKKRMNNINDAGVRDVDREGLDQRVAQIQSFYQNNKDKIRKAGTTESYAYEKMFRDVSGYVNQSKERTARGDAAMKLYNERLKQDGRIPDDFINELHENEAGIDKLTGLDAQTGEPRKSKPLDLKKWLSQPKPFNQQTYLKSFGDIKRTATIPAYSPVQGNPLKLTETIDEVFDKEAAQVIHARTADKYQNSFSFAEQVKAEVTDPVRRKQLEDTFRNQFGTNPAIPEDYATAYTLELLQPKISKVKTVDNKEAIINKQQQFSKEQQERAHRNSLSRLYVYANIQDRKPETIGRNIDEIIANHIQDARNNNGEVVTDNATFESITGKKKTGNSLLKFDEANNKYVYGTKDETGAFNPTGEVPVDLGRIKLTKTYKSGLDSKYNTGKTPPPSQTPTYKRADLLNNGWTEEKIKIAVKAGKIKVN